LKFRSRLIKIEEIEAIEEIEGQKKLKLKLLMGAKDSELERGFDFVPREDP
jgi:hypothetical protein